MKLSIRESLLKLFIILSIICIFITESLSLFSLINATSIRISWTIAAVILLFWGLKKGFFKIFNQFSFIRFIEFIKPYRWAVILLIFAVLIPLFMLAITVRPNNYDGVTYHFGRVVFWIQNQNLDIFPTQMMQALYHNVGSEYLLMNIFLFTGTDKFLNLVQYSSMIGSVAGIMLICKQLGLSRQIQAFAAIIAATLPIGVLESTTIQNDYLAACYLISFIYFVLKIIKQNQTQLSQDTLFAALAITLAGFTKYTGLMFGLPFAIWLGIYYIRKANIKQTVLILGSTICILLLVFLPFFGRNYRDFGSIIAPKLPSDLAVEKYSTDIIAPHTAIANASKYYFFHFALPSESINQKIEGFVNKIHVLLGVAPDDKRISFIPFDAYFTITEDASGNWLAVVFLTLSIIIMIIRFKAIPTPIWIFTLCTFGGLLIYASLIKWQLYHTRTHIHFFLMGSIIIAYTFIDVVRIRILYKILPFLFIIGSLPYVYTNPYKQLISLKYAVKYLIGSIPRRGIIETKNTKATEKTDKAVSVLMTYGYKKEAFGEFTFIVPPAEGSLSLQKRREIVSKMSDLNYEGYSKNELISQYTTEEQYYLNKLKYKSIIELLNSVPKTEKVIGLAQFRHYYASNHWMVCRRLFGDDFRIQYAYVSDEFREISNLKNYQPFEYIWTDTAEFSQKIDAQKIDWIKQFGEYYLIKLKQKQTEPFYY